MARVWRSITSITSAAASAAGWRRRSRRECTPASSTCSITPPISTSPVASRMASTSTSTASSRKRSISTGRSAVRPPSRAEGAGGRAERGPSPRPGRRVVDDPHGPAAEHVAGPDQHREAHPVGDGERLLEGGGGAAGRLRDLQLGAQGVPAVPVLGPVDAVGAGADHQVAGQPPGQLERRLAAQRDDHAEGRTPPAAAAARPRSRSARPRASAARSRGGRWCRSRSRRSPGCSSPSRSRSRRPGGRSWRGRSSSRTRCPARCGWGPTRG